MRGKRRITAIVSIVLFLILIFPITNYTASDSDEWVIPEPQKTPVKDVVAGFPLGWTDDIRLTNTADHIQDVEPVIAVGNNLHLVWEKDTTGIGGHYDIFYINTTTCGKSWNNPIPLTEETSGIYYRHPDMVVSDNNINIVWDSINFGRIVYRNSIDGGISWSDTQNISIDDGWHSDFPKIATNGSEIHIVWIDERHRNESIPWNTELYYVRSLNGGITWDDGLGNVGQERRITNALYESCGQEISVEGDALHLVWGDTRNGIISGEIYYKRSLDKGATWDDGLGNINQDRVLTTNLTNSHGLPTIAVNGSTIHIAWVDIVGGGPPYHIYYRKSTDNGANWGPIKLLVDSGMAWDPSIAVSDEDLHLVFHDGRNGVSSEVYYINSTDGGITWNPEIQLTIDDANNSGGSSIAVTDEKVHVAWVGTEWVPIEDDNREIYYKRYPDFPSDPEINITLQEGWNLVSLPLEQSGESIDQVLNSIIGKWDCIQTYDAINDNWLSNVTFRPSQLNDFSTLNHKQGFWINITEPGGVNLTVSGDVPASTTIPLYTGWNLVGYPTLYDTETVANALWGTGADKVEVFDPGEPYRIREVGPTYLMKPGEGYWVHVPVDSVWVVDW